MILTEKEEEGEVEEHNDSLEDKKAFQSKSHLIFSKICTQEFVAVTRQRKTKKK